jgi:hypothetical protein
MDNEWITCQECGYSTTVPIIFYGEPHERRMNVSEIDGEYVDLCSSCDTEDLETVKEGE